MRGHRLVSDQDLPIRMRCTPDQLGIWSILSGNALIAAGLVFVAEDEQGAPLGYVALRPTGMGGLILLEGIFVDPVCARSGVGTRLFATAVEHSRKMAGSVILVYSSPNSVGFYARLGAIRIGMTPFVFSPEVQLSMFEFSIPPFGENGASTA